MLCNLYSLCKYQKINSSQKLLLQKRKKETNIEKTTTSKHFVKHAICIVCIIKCLKCCYFLLVKIKEIITPAIRQTVYHEYNQSLHTKPIFHLKFRIAFNHIVSNTPSRTIIFKWKGGKWYFYTKYADHLWKVT